MFVLRGLYLLFGVPFGMFFFLWEAVYFVQDLLLYEKSAVILVVVVVVVVVVPVVVG